MKEPIDYMHYTDEDINSVFKLQTI